MTSVPPVPGEMWEQIPTAVQQALLVVFAQYELRLQELQQHIAELEQRLGTNSSNSSKPPSSDGPEVKRAPPKPRSGRPKGGQPGHPRSTRPLLPPTQTFVCKPAACRHCGEALAGDDPEPLRHQVLELPQVEPIVLEYQRHRLLCPCCGITTCAELPQGVPPGGQGPRLQATIAMLTGAYRLSKRQVEVLMDDLFGVPVCAATVCAVEQEVATIVDPVVAPMRQHIKDQPVNMDETSWWQGQQRAWLWVAVTAYLTVYELVASRGAKVAREMLGAGYRRTVTSDRFKSYAFLALSRRQLCWAHLRRDFQAMIDRNNQGSAIGRKLLAAADELFKLWQKVRDGTHDRRWFAGHLRNGLRRKVSALLVAGTACGCAKTEATCDELVCHEPALWAFAYREGVEPTNNAAERALRHAVLWRRNSHGTESAAGSHFVANILSVVETCRQQGKKVLDVLTACCESSLHHSPLPSLLPVANG